MLLHKKVKCIKLQCHFPILQRTTKESTLFQSSQRMPMLLFQAVYSPQSSVKRLYSYFESCCDIMRSVFGKCLYVFVVNLFHLLYISGILPANWGIKKSPIPLLFFLGNQKQPALIFVSGQARLDNNFPGSHRQHHPSLERWSFGSSLSTLPKIEEA